MTRTEELTKKETDAKAAIADAKRALARVRAQRRTDAKKARAKRALVIGEIADEAGLLVWDDTTLRQVFCVVAHLVETPDPAAVLEGLLAGPVQSYSDGPEVDTL